MAQLERYSDVVKNCIQECMSCFSICEETVRHCLDKGGRHSSADHIEIMRNCVDICQLSAGFMLSKSEFQDSACGLCAEICNRCEESCNTMLDDDQMRVCAEACHRCADACRQMSGGGARVTAMPGVSATGTVAVAGEGPGRGLGATPVTGTGATVSRGETTPANIAANATGSAPGKTAPDQGGVVSPTEKGKKAA